MSNLKAYEVKENGWTILLQSGAWCIYPGDILFFEENGIIMKSNAPVFNTCYKLVKMYYNSPEFDPNKSDVERSLIKKLAIETRMVWLNDINLNNTNFKHDRTGAWYGVNEVFEYGEKWRNGSKEVSKEIGNLLEDITVSWNRENKLEEVGI